MEQIVVKKPSGITFPLFRTDPVSVVTRAEQYRVLLGEDTLKLTVESTAKIDFGVGDTVVAFGEEYTLNRMPTARKNGRYRFVYDLTLEGSQYTLLRVLYFNTDISGVATGTEFTLTGDLASFATVLMNNVNRVLTGWTLGTVPVGTTVKTLSFNNENCLAVLQKLCQEYGTEFEIIRNATTGARNLRITKIGQVLGQVFEYGRGGGLYTLSRQTVSDKEFITRLYAFGSTKNLKSNYRNFSPRLRMNTTGSYLEKADAKQAFGLIEGTKTFEDIYPHRTGIVTAPTGLLSFTDVGMDFDLNAANSGGETTYLVAGVPAKIHFNSGQLAGYEFQIASYVHATKTFTLLAFKDERGQSFPTAGAFAVAAGDRYVLLDIVMPETYITAAETELQTAAQLYLDQNAAPRVQYALEVDELYLKGRTAFGSLTNFFLLGDFLEIKDDDLAINKASRIVGYRRDLIRPYKYSLDIADTYDITLVERILAEQAEIKSVVRLVDTSNPVRARAGWRTTQELQSLIFDTDDYFKGGNIRPNSVETQMLTVGAKSQQFILNCVIEPNLQGTANAVQVNAGSLTHYTIEETIRTWQIGLQGFIIQDNEARYIYARCNKTNYNDGNLLFSTAQIKPNDSPTYYHFLVGVLHAVDTVLNIRWISLTYGATAINGRFVKTGRIQSFDGATYFDLDAGEIGGKITFVSTGGSKKGVKEVDDLAKSKRRVFVTQPVPPYEIGDLWSDGVDLRRCASAKLPPLTFSLSDWTKATNYDNTVTTIDGGIVTSGTIQLAGEGGSILAGITGDGTSNDSVRIWGGATYENRAVAPFRVLQSGEAFVRKRIELTNDTNVGQAGISGANTAAEASSAEGRIRIWSGADHANRATAPFRVNSEGEMTATAGRFGGWRITGEGIVNEDGTAYIIARSSTSIRRTEARIGANVFPASAGGKGAGYMVATETDPYADNVALLLEAANGSNNYAIYAKRGISLLNEALVNGRRYHGQTVNNRTLLIDPSKYDVIEIFPEGPICGLKFTEPELPLNNGKMMTIINANNPYGNFYLFNMIRGNGQVKIDGGAVVTLIYTNRFWLIANSYDNNFPNSAPPFIVEPVNNPPKLDFPQPDRTIHNVSAKAWVVPANAFSDPGDVLTYSAKQQNGQPLPAGITFDSGTRVYTVSNSLPDHSVIYLQTVATDSDGQTAVDNFLLTIDWLGTPAPPSNPAPTVANPLANQSIVSVDTETIPVPANVFSDPGDTLTLTAKQEDNSPLPTGISFNPSTRLYTILATVPAGVYYLKTIATDSAGQTVADSFAVTIDRTGGLPEDDLSTLQHVMITTAEPNDRRVLNPRIARFDSATGEFYLELDSNPETVGNTNWKYFTAGLLHTRQELLDRPFAVRFPILISIHMADNDKPEYLQREQPAPNDQITVMYI